MESIISAAVAMLSASAPLLAGAGPVGAAISLVAAILPPAINLAKNEIPVIKGIIATLRGNKTVTAEQMADLDKLDAQCDAVLDAAIKKAEDDDAGAGAT